MNPSKPVEPMPPAVQELLEVVKVQSDTIALRLYIFGAEPDIRAAYAKIAEQKKQLNDNSNLMAISSDVLRKDKELIINLTSQLSTLKAQMKEVIKAGDEMSDSLKTFRLKTTEWEFVTAALRQSGQGSTE